MDITGDLSRDGTQGKGAGSGGGVSLDSVLSECSEAGSGVGVDAPALPGDGQTQCRLLLSRLLRVGSLPSRGV